METTVFCEAFTCGSQLLPTTLKTCWLVFIIVEESELLFPPLPLPPLPLFSLPFLPLPPLPSPPLSPLSPPSFPSLFLSLLLSVLSKA